MSSNYGPRKRKAIEIVGALQALLSEDAQPLYANMKPAMLRPEQYERLGAIYDQLRPSGQNSTSTPISDSMDNTSSIGRMPRISDLAPTGDISPTAEDPSALTANSLSPSGLEISSKPSKRGRPSKTPKEGPKINECWKGVKDLIQIRLEPELSGLIEDIKEKPSSELAAVFIAQCRTQYSSLVGNDGYHTELLASLCVHLNKRVTTTVIDAFCWLFEALAVGDMFVAVFGRTCILRIPKMVKQAVQNAVAQGDRSEDFPNNVKEGLTFARNVYFICDLLGTGSLFFLRPKLTKHFLKNLVTKNVDILNEMTTNFTKQGFSQEIEQSGAKKVGDVVRAHLRVFFKLDKVEPGSDPTTTAAPISTLG